MLVSTLLDPSLQLKYKVQINREARTPTKQRLHTSCSRSVQLVMDESERKSKSRCSTGETKGVMCKNKSKLTPWQQLQVNKFCVWPELVAVLLPLEPFSNSSRFCAGVKETLDAPRIATILHRIISFLPIDPSPSVTVTTPVELSQPSCFQLYQQVVYEIHIKVVENLYKHCDSAVCSGLHYKHLWTRKRKGFYLFLLHFYLKPGHSEQKYNFKTFCPNLPWPF